MKRLMYSICCVCLLAVFITGCRKNNDTMPALAPDAEVYALTSDNRILVINARNTASIIATLPVSGLQTGETLLGIDFRPNTGQLFAVGSTSRLYTVNSKTGAATAVGTAPFTPAISGNFVGFDFNPTVDRIRLVTSSGQNLRLNPENGMVAAVDGNINGAAGAVVNGVAYTQNRAGATSTVLFDIDVTTNKLYRQDPPNAGTLAAVGDLGVDAEGVGGFDIAPDSTVAFAALSVGGANGLYAVNLSTGAATKLGDLPAQIIGLAIPTQAVAYAVATDNSLLIIDLNAGSVSLQKTISGLQTSELILGIDLRPATGQLYALGSTSRLYTINISTGAATLVGAGALTTVLAGTDFGFDFNPTVDRIRVVSNTGQNLRLNPVDGSVAAVDGAINPASVSISGSAYTNNFAGATTTTLFNIDAQSDKLVKQDPPNAGTIVEVGALGINIEAANGFDIGGTSGNAYGIFTVSGVSRLYAVNLATGAVTQGPSLQNVRGFALGLGL